MSDLFDSFEVISTYTLEDALQDGSLVELLPSQWQQMSGGIPVVVTARVYADLTLVEKVEVWNGFVAWKRDIEPALPEEDRLFTTEVNGKTVWVVEDGAAFTLMYPEDY